MLDQINRRLAALQAKNGEPRVHRALKSTPRHAVRPPPLDETPTRVQTPIVIDGQQVGIIHGDKPMDTKSRKAVTEVVRTAFQSMKDGTLKTLTAPPRTKEKRMPKPKKEATKSVRHDGVPGAKTIGVKIAPALYERLEQIKTRHNLTTIKDALVLAAERGAYGLDAT